MIVRYGLCIERRHINEKNYLDVYQSHHKQLHFLIIGFFGFCMLMVIQPIFRWLIRHHADLMITFLYVFTIVVVISFGIEIGQAYSGTGDMDFYDIASGILGFFTFFGIYLIGYLVFHGVRNGLRKES